MKYENFNRFTDAEFEHFLGVSRRTFTAMLEVMKKFELDKKKSGRPHSLTLRDQLLLSLIYLKRHKTQSQLALIFKIAESNINRTISKVQQALDDHPQLDLPQRRRNANKSVLASLAHGANT